jgi:hypothetical protein
MGALVLTGSSFLVGTAFEGDPSAQQGLTRVTIAEIFHPTHEFLIL